MFQVFMLLVVPFWTSANSYNGEKNVQKQIETLQNTVNELKDLVHVQNHRNDRLELELLKSRNDMEQMKETYLIDIENINSRISNLELIKAKCHRVLTTLKRDDTNIKKYVYTLNSRLSRQEKIQTAMLEVPQELRNLSDANSSMDKEKSENGNRDVNRIQRADPGFEVRGGKALMGAQGAKLIIDNYYDLLSQRLLTPTLPPSNSHNGVAFYAFMSSILPSPSTEHVLVFDVAKTNIGNAYHPNTGVFIVPESGVYVFTWTFRIAGINDHSIQLIVNREDVGSVYLRTINGVDDEATGFVVTHVNAGDDVFVRTHPQLQIGTGHYINSNAYGRSSFAGWKIF